MAQRKMNASKLHYLDQPGAVMVPCVECECVYVCTPVCDICCLRCSKPWSPQLQCAEKQWETCFCLCSGSGSVEQACTSQKHAYGSVVSPVFLAGKCSISLNERDSGNEWEGDEKNVNAKNKECSQALCTTPRWLVVQHWWVDHWDRQDILSSS